MASLTNGEKANSKFISHVTSYPIVNDSINGFAQNPYGKKSLEIADGAYQKFAKPVEPYLETPYSYAKPYVTKADELADSGLGKVDAHFPIVKEDTKTIVETGKSYIFWPVKVASDGKDYVFSTWDDEYKKTAKHKDRGQGITTSVLALVSTQLKISSDFFQTVADFLGPKYQEGKKTAGEYANSAKETAESYAESGKGLLGDAQRTAEKKGDELKGEAQKTKDEAAKKGEEVKGEAKKTKDEAQKKASK